MEIRNTRYQELVREEITYQMIRDFIHRERGELSDKSILDHVSWLIRVQEEKEENR